MARARRSMGRYVLWPRTEEGGIGARKKMSGVTGQLGELDGGEELHEGLFISAGRRWRGEAAVVAGRRAWQAALMVLGRLRASRSGVSSGEAA
jgi:hypothetical protein